jgi:hypothetical protein
LKKKEKSSDSEVDSQTGHQIDLLGFVRVETPPHATLKGLAEALLAKLGDPMPSRGTHQSMTIRIIERLRDRKAKGVILDEFQHLIDRRGATEKVAHDAADWVKGLLNEAQCPFLLVGTESAEDVIESNEQLKRRCTSIARLMPFGYSTSDAREAFNDLMVALETCLGLPKPSDLGSDDMAARIHYATFGLIGHIVRLLEAALFLEMDRMIGRLTKETLADAFAQSLTRYDGRVNPFTTKEAPTLTPHQARTCGGRRNSRGDGSTSAFQGAF